MTMGEKIQLLRKSQKWSQEILAEKLSVSRQAVSLWERNESQPELDKLLAIAKLFSVTTDYLIDNSLEEPHAASFRKTTEAASVPARHLQQTLPLATFLDIAGLLISALLWKEFQREFLLIPGLLLQILSVVLSLFCYYHLDLSTKKRTLHRWFSVNLWFLLPIPILWLSRILFSLLPLPYPCILPNMFALILYLTICPLTVRFFNKP